MDNKRSFDLTFIIPLLLGMCSIFGICLVLLLGRLSAARAIRVVEETSTPYKFLFLGTEPGISTITPGDEPTEVPTSTPIEFEFSTSTPEPESLTTLEPGTGTPSTLAASTLASATTEVTSSTAPLNPGTYDENDVHIAYDGDWIQQTDVAGVFKNTLHVSNTLGNSMSLRFIGEQVRIFYQSGSSLGTVRINMDGIQFDLDQSASTINNSEWVSPLLINGTHTVTITHLSGGSINIDYFIVPDTIKTPSPTSSTP